MTFIALLLSLLAVGFRYGASDEMRQRVAYALRWAFGVGAVGFSLGFFGPMLFAPGANQGPLLGIFITGPLGFASGLVWGLIVGRRRPVGDVAR